MQQPNQRVVVCRLGQQRRDRALPALVNEILNEIPNEIVVEAAVGVQDREALQLRGHHRAEQIETFPAEVPVTQTHQCRNPDLPSREPGVDAATLHHPPRSRPRPGRRTLVATLARQESTPVAR